MLSTRPANGPASWGLRVSWQRTGPVRIGGPFWWPTAFPLAFVEWWRLAGPCGRHSLCSPGRVWPSLMRKSLGRGLDWRPSKAYDWPVSIAPARSTACKWRCPFGGQCRRRASAPGAKGSQSGAICVRWIEVGRLWGLAASAFRAPSLPLWWSRRPPAGAPVCSAIAVAPASTPTGRSSPSVPAPIPRSGSPSATQNANKQLRQSFEYNETLEKINKAADARTDSQPVYN